MREDSLVAAGGTTAQERAAAFPCDAHHPEITKQWFRAADLEAPPEIVFRWLCQLRVAPYSYDLLDNFGRRSPRRLTPGLEQLELGQKFMILYELVDFEPGGSITISLKKLRAAFGPRTVTYRVTPRGSGSRLVTKARFTKPALPMGLTVPIMLPWIDLIMTRKQMRVLGKLSAKQAAGG